MVFCHLVIRVDGSIMHKLLHYKHAFWPSDHQHQSFPRLVSTPQCNAPSIALMYPRTDQVSARGLILFLVQELRHIVQILPSGLKRKSLALGKMNPSLSSSFSILE